MSTKVVLKKVIVGERSQKVTKKRVTSIPCDTSFPCHFARIYRQWWSSNPMTSLSLTCNGWQFKFKSNEIKFSNQHFCINGTSSWLRIASGFQICALFSSTLCRAPRTCKSKNGVIPFSLSYVIRSQKSIYLFKFCISLVDI